jgi:hypothetical protein
MCSILNATNAGFETSFAGLEQRCGDGTTSLVKVAKVFVY